MNSPLRQLGKRVDDFVYTRAVKWFGGSAEAYKRLASRYEMLEWWDEAVQAYEKAIAKDPQAQSHLQLAHVLGRVGKIDEAFAQCREALRLDESLPAAHVFLGM